MIEEEADKRDRERETEKMFFRMNMEKGSDEFRTKRERGRKVQFKQKYITKKTTRRATLGTDCMKTF